MSKKNIEKYDIFYLLLRKYVDFWHNYIYYRKVIVYGRDRIDFSVPTIYAPNHQNALMDALAVLCTLKKQPIFLARADIFRNKFIARILYRFKMLPVFRIRDGYENLKQNDETFNDTLRVMESCSGLVILPEGNHAGFRRLRQLKKGICRIAFQTAEASNYTKEINIVPVGLEFTHYWLFRQVLTVVYGHPIAVSEYYDIYKENPNKGLLDLRDRLSSEMKKVMVHIGDENDYEALNELRSIVNEKYSDSIRYPKLFRDTRLVEKINNLREPDPKSYREICDDSLAIRDLTKQLHITYRLLRKKKHPFGWLTLSSLFLLVTLPVFILGAALNLIIFKVPDLQSRKVKDEAFISTIRYGLTLALSFIIFPLYLVLTLIFIKPWWLALAAFLAIPVTGLLAWNWLLLYRRTVGGFRVRTLIAVNNPAFIRLRDTYNSLTQRISRL
ncbi:MAG: 1-acyl-sn-glycerol-3-phosphate acyltransferase [Bacteroidales bacterium]|jgi:1-acyl-sn-glycerol-3-phosphate acyltransferase|nr:1-acyl-sn-glycerol-3-phosphate acyltransferase [Bacteroidales bacterium]